VWLYYLDEFRRVDCGGLSPVDCALKLAAEAGCEPERWCMWRDAAEPAVFAIEIYCKGGLSAKLMPSPEALEAYYASERERICAEALN
jgi:hypothetical protein